MLTRFGDHGLAQTPVPASCLVSLEVGRLAALLIPHTAGQAQERVPDKLCTPYLNRTRSLHFPGMPNRDGVLGRILGDNHREEYKTSAREYTAGIRDSEVWGSLWGR